MKAWFENVLFNIANANTDNTVARIIRIIFVLIYRACLYSRGKQGNHVWLLQTSSSQLQHSAKKIPTIIPARQIKIAVPQPRTVVPSWRVLRDYWSRCRYNVFLSHFYFIGSVSSLLYWIAFLYYADQF